MKKSILLWLLVVSLLPNVNAWINTTSGAPEMDYLFTNWGAVGTKLTDGVAQNFEFRYSKLGIGTIPDNYVIIKLVSESPQSNTTFFYSCDDGASDSIDLSDQPNWLTEGRFFFPVPLSPISSLANYTIQSFQNYEETVTIENAVGRSCIFAVNNQDVFLQAYYHVETGYVGDYSGDYSCGTTDRFSIPNEALAGMVNRTADTVVSLFNLMDMSIMVAGFLLLMFIIVSVYKVFMFFIKVKP